MFIPRTLAEIERGPARGALGRALIVIAIVAAVLFLVPNANITLGQGDFPTLPQDRTYSLLA